MSKRINVKNMFGRGAFGFLVGLLLGIFVSSFVGEIMGLPATVFVTVFFVVLLGTTFLFGWFGAREKTNEERQESALSKEVLNKNEKLWIWIFSIINPIITGGICYFMWRNVYPKKAKEANHISMIVFLLCCLFLVAVVFLRNY